MRLLLDEHLAVAAALREQGLAARTLPEWENGALLQRSDAVVLDAACAEGWTLVTYDLRTIPTLLEDWSEAGRSHGGVVVVDDKTIRTSDASALIGALQALAAGQGHPDWRDRVIYLQRPTQEARPNPSNRTP